MEPQLNKADFYIGYLPFAQWIGSLYEGGSIWEIPANILVQTDGLLYEVAVLEYLKTKKSSIKENGDIWPWLWADSRETDYSYLFIPELNKVGLSIKGDIIVDPFIILQGEDINSATLKIGHPLFPIMISPPLTKYEELIKRYSNCFSLRT